MWKLMSRRKRSGKPTKIDASTSAFPEYGRLETISGEFHVPGHFGNWE
jgi:hypothetical protein